MSICIVFVPVTLLSGSAKYVFTPLALNVVLALVASYGLSRTLVPTMMHFLLPQEVPLYQGQEKESPLSRSFIWRLHQRFDRGFDRFAEKYKAALEWALGHAAMTLISFSVGPGFAGPDSSNRRVLPICGFRPDGIPCTSHGERGLKRRFRCSGKWTKEIRRVHPPAGAADGRKQYRAAAGRCKPCLFGERHDE